MAVDRARWLDSKSRIGTGHCRPLESPSRHGSVLRRTEFPQCPRNRHFAPATRELLPGEDGARLRNELNVTVRLRPVERYDVGSPANRMARPEGRKTWRSGTARPESVAVMPREHLVIRSQAPAAGPPYPVPTLPTPRALPGRQSSIFVGPQQPARYLPRPIRLPVPLALRRCPRRERGRIDGLAAPEIRVQACRTTPTAKSCSASSVSR